MTASWIFIVASLCLFGCGQPSATGPAVQEETSDTLINPSDTLRAILGDVHPIDSLDVLSYLKTLRARSPQNKGRRLIAYTQADSNWIKRTDIPALLSQIGSIERACCVMSVFSSLWVAKDEYATIGGHAMDLIDAYRFGLTYPPLKTCPKADTARMAAIRKWWNEGGQPIKKEPSL